VFETVINSM